MMHHHGSQPYDVAVSQAAAHFQQKLEEKIHAAVARVERVIDQVETQVPEDAIAKGKALAFGVNQAGLHMLPPEGATLTIHKHALGQIVERTGVRHLATVVRDLQGRGGWGRELIAHNLNELYSHMHEQRYLLRSVKGELRGFLSDKFRRLDNRPLLDAFIKAISKWGARPADGFALETVIRVRAYLPYIFEPFPGEVLAFGAELGNSDYGDGMLTLSAFAERMWCTNLAVTTSVLEQVHLGKRLPDSIQFSDRTLQLDTQTMSSALNDLTGNVLSPQAVNAHLDLVRRANDQKVEPAKINAWVKANASKEEGEKLLGQWNSADVQTLPQGQSNWRFSNAVSWLARETADERRKLELQDMAGKILTVKATPQQPALA